MLSPQAYLKKISDLKIEKWKINISSVEDAKNALLILHNFQKELWEIKQYLETDILKAKTKIIKAKNPSSGQSFLSTLLKNKNSKTKQTKTSKSHLNKLNQALSDYKEISVKIDKRLSQLEQAKSKLHNYLLQAKNQNDRDKRTALKASSPPKENINYKEYIKSTEWRLKAEEAKARAGNRCQICNRSRAEIQLDAHHRTYERLGNERDEDITVLCRDCHELYESQKREREYAEQVEKGGICIRCGEPIKFNPKSPYCGSCYHVWRKFNNKGYLEKYCHACGNENESTMLKPVCLDCYKKIQK